MKQIYLDNAATTKLDNTVATAIKKFQEEYFANPSSPHKLGREVREKIEQARKIIAEEINAEPNEIIFTSGGSESNNLAIKGLSLNQKLKTGINNSKELDKNPPEIITSEIEHPCILETCNYLEKLGFKIKKIPVNPEGIINPKDIEKAITKNTILVSIMHVNNEIGTIQPIKKIGKICKDKKIPFHTDATQSFHKIKIDVEKQNISMLTASGHKIHAPKGIGFLYIKKELQKRLTPLIHGGHQENSLRAGTENTTGIIGLSEAIKQKPNKSQIKKRRDKIMKEILKIPEAKLNGSIKYRIYNNINLSFYGIEGESIVMKLEERGIMCSTGSACSSKKLSHSHVLKAIKTDELYINSSIRLTLDKNNPKDEKETDYIIKTLTQTINQLKKISPFKLNKGGKNDR